MGARVVYVCDAPHRDPVVASVEAAGPRCLTRNASSADRTRQCRNPPPGADQGRSFATTLLDTYQPKAVVFIEKTGPNARGVHHSIMGSAKDPNETGHAFTWPTWPENAALSPLVWGMVATKSATA